MKDSLSCLLILLLVFSVSQRLNADEPPPTPEGLAFFEKRIRPLFIEHCYECHSTGKKAKGGLTLDTRHGTRTGGDSGPTLIPGDPEHSPLVEAVRYKNRDRQMPPKGPLSEAQVRDLEAWVAMGAPDPRDAPPAEKPQRPEFDLEQGRRHWSFQPLANPAIPSVTHRDWVRTPIDAFVLERLEHSGLAPAPAAEKRTLLRRVTMNLLGLPPTPDEVEAFVADDSPEAFERVIERLLADPSYGERWGRHWLDVARYADSNGLDENIAYGHSWRYRDWVVRAFNEDKPYDQFLIEQLAGDLLPAASEAARIEQFTGTGFLAIGARVLAEPDVRKLEMDLIDEQLDTLGRAFLGMTLGCCRCHDHKFDPLPTSDYNALAAIFRSTKSLADERMGAVKFWYEHSLASPADLEAKKQHDAKVATQASQVAQVVAELRKKLLAELHARAADYLAAAAELPDEPDFDQVASLAAQRGLRPRYLLTCRQYLAHSQDQPVFAQWRTLAMSNQLEEIRAHYAALFTEAAAALQEAKTKDEKATRPADERLAAAHDALHDVAGFLAIPEKEADAFDAEMQAAASPSKLDLATLKSQGPEPPALMGVRDGQITRHLPIHIRGSYLTLGPSVERGFPQVMTASAPAPILPARQSGRLQLARWMAAGDHPLTARVIVNRIWRWHFGVGLCRTTDNFGRLGEAPSHPELLDWLARRFVESGWSVKELHRMILQSQVYQLAARHPAGSIDAGGAQPETVDPENRLLWRAHIQRLEAEQIRDALFAVSDSLNRVIGGKSIPLKNREYVFDHTSIDNTRYETTRRALYLPIIRNHLYDMLEQFDYPDPTVPTGDRAATVVAPQALLMLNAPVVRTAAELLADELLALDEDAVRVREIYLRL
ncbi:MAG: PSD1 and planctomycete cytochrome C domain-containing protein [Planctomycetales bacterium]